MCAPVANTRLSQVKRSPLTSTVFLSTTVAAALRMYSMSSCSLDCQFMKACGLFRAPLNTLITSTIEARDSSNFGNQSVSEFHRM